MRTLAAAAAVVAVLAGCSASQETATTVTEAETVTVTVTTVDAATVTETQSVTVTVPEADAAADGEAAGGSSLVLRADGKSQTKEGVRVQVNGVAIDEGLTGVGVTIRNDSDEPCNFSYLAELVADGTQYNDGSGDLSDIASHAETDSLFYWEEAIPADTSTIRLIARCLHGDFGSGNLLEFDIKARLVG
ncbi:MAG: hypothetical protein KJ058_00620 [Thermoanaerobaculia bacterium]|nr:hypothetical protein [Thermoanaerobaculia bacterium]